MSRISTVTPIVESLDGTTFRVQVGSEIFSFDVQQIADVGRGYAHVESILAQFFVACDTAGIDPTQANLATLQAVLQNPIKIVQ